MYSIFHGIFAAICLYFMFAATSSFVVTSACIGCIIIAIEPIPKWQEEQRLRREAEERARQLREEQERRRREDEAAANGSTLDKTVHAVKRGYEWFLPAAAVAGTVAAGAYMLFTDKPIPSGAATALSYLEKRRQ